MALLIGGTSVYKGRNPADGGSTVVLKNPPANLAVFEEGVFFCLKNPLYFMLYRLYPVLVGTIQPEGELEKFPISITVLNF